MKKIVGIIAALALASSVFADPDVAPTVVTFDGKASLEWIANLDAKTTGMKNAEEATFKVKFISEGTKENPNGAPEMWGELKIKAAEVAVEAKHAAPDGDKAGTSWVVPTPSVESAKIHFTDDDFYVRMNIKAPGLSLGGGKYVLATRSDDDKKANPSTSVSLTGAQGFTLEFGLTDLVEFNFQFADNGQQPSSAKKYAFVFDATLIGKGIDMEGLSVTAGVGYSTEEEKAAFAAKASYKLAIDDKFYVTPSVGFSFKDKAKALGAAVLFGWGAENSEPGFAKFTSVPDEFKDNVPNKCSDGVSIWLTSDLDTSYGFLFSVYDSTFVPGLKVGADFQADLKNFDAGWEFNAAAKYSNTFDIWTLDANFGLKLLNVAKTTNAGFLYGFGISTDDSLIQKTKLYINYVGETAKKLGGQNLKGTVTVGTQIHF